MQEYHTLIDTQTLAGRLTEAGLAIVDCRYQLQDSAAGENAYRTAHLPGARYAHLGRDLSGPGPAEQGRNPLPDPRTLAQTLSSWGIGGAVQVVAYDDAGGAMAARLWWLLRWLGHDRVALLDGGWNRWVAEQRPVETEVITPRPAKFEVRLNPALTARADELLQPGLLVLDARGAKRFRGEEEPLDARAGHIPGARNHPYTNNLDERGCFKSPRRLASQFRAVLEGTPPDQVVCSCGSGVSACHNLLAMEIAGLAGARLYPPSWSGWIADSSRPVATGD